MKQLLVRTVEDGLVARLKSLAARNGISVEEQHRRLLAESLNRAQIVREPFATYLVNHPVSPEVEIPLERSKESEERETGFQ